MVRRCHGDGLHVPRQHGARFVPSHPHLPWCAERDEISEQCRTRRPRALEHSCRRCLLVGACSHARCRRLCSCSLLNSQSVFFAHSSALVPLSQQAASRSCPPFIGLQAWTQLRIRAASGVGAYQRRVRLCEPPSAMQEGTSPSLSSPDRDLASVYLARSRTAVPIRDFDPIAAQVRQCLACPPSAPCQLNALQQPPCSHIECRSISRHRPEAPLRGPRSLQTTTQPRQLHPHHRSVRS